MLLDVSNIPFHQRSISLYHQQVLGVLLLGGLGEIERPGDQRLRVDDHDLVVGDGMLVVDVGRNTSVRDEVSGCVLLRWLLTRSTTTFTTRFLASISAFAIGLLVNEYACTRISVFADSSSLTMASVATPFGEK